MVNMTLYLDVPTREELLKAIEGWEESVRWIAHGWDCEDEYWNDLGYRETLARVADCYTSLTPLSKTLRRRIERADDRFRKVTVASRLCVWDTAAKIGARNGPVTFACDKYDSERYWYYYRWPPSAPDVYRKYDVYELQKNCYGLDFKHATEQELKRVARELVDEIHTVTGCRPQESQPGEAMGTVPAEPKK